MTTHFVEITDGPSNWDMLLAGFDKKPAQSHGIRQLRFVIKGGGTFFMELAGLSWPRYPSEDLLVVRGFGNTLMPKGYLPDNGEEVLIKYDPNRRAGSMQVRLVSPCHYGIIQSSKLDEVLVGSCMNCNRRVMRKNPRTGTLEWLDGAPALSPRDDLRTTGVIQTETPAPAST